jgi:hypothetical protein
MAAPIDFDIVVNATTTICSYQIKDSLLNIANKQKKSNNSRYHRSCLQRIRERVAVRINENKIPHSTTTDQQDYIQREEETRREREDEKEKKGTVKIVYDTFNRSHAFDREGKDAVDEEEEECDSDNNDGDGDEQTKVHMNTQKQYHHSDTDFDGETSAVNKVIYDDSFVNDTRKIPTEDVQKNQRRTTKVHERNMNHSETADDTTTSYNHVPIIGNEGRCMAYTRASSALRNDDRTFYDEEYINDKYPPGCGMAVENLCLSRGMRHIDMLMIIAYPIIACIILVHNSIFSYEENPNMLAQNVFTMMASIVPIGSLSLFGASGRHRTEAAKFGMIYGIFLLAMSAISAGISLGCLVDFGSGHCILSQIQKTFTAFEIGAFFTFGLYISVRCKTVRQDCITVQRENADLLAEVVEDAPTNREIALISERVVDRFNTMLAWMHAFTVVIVTMDIITNGGPQTRQILSCIMALSVLLPVFQETIFLDLLSEIKNGAPKSRVMCGIYVALATSSAIAQIVFGIIMPGIKMVTNFIHVKKNGPNIPHKFMSHICGGSSSATSNECAILTLRTYVVIVISSVICIYSSWVITKIAFKREYKKIKGKFVCGKKCGRHKYRT